MTDAPPQLGEISYPSEMSLPTLQSGMDDTTSPNGNVSVQNAKDTVYNSKSFHSSRDMFDLNKLHHRCSICCGHCSTPSGYTNCQRIHQQWSGPVVETVKDQHAKTASEFRNLAGSRASPSNPAATGQPLTHYHSFFYNLLSWENPRATALSFLTTILFIFAARYLPALRWSFKILYLTLGVTAAAEVAGKLVFSQGLATSFRPRKYYTIPRESLEASLDDVEQLINFFVIEFQRVLFAENVVHTCAAGVAALVSYSLIKFLPFWGLSLIAASTIYLGPLIYINNKELIDQQLETATHVINAQASQVKDLAGHHAGRASDSVKAYAGDYSAKAQNYIGSARGRSNSPEVSNSGIKSEAGDAPKYSSTDFPHAPKQEPTPGTTSHQEQYEKSKFGGQAEPAY